ncbi:MFS transporter [Williamsia serinedens]|uniref:Arabinose efflux permease, MFS family n=1 Tax=Williamsia serinedens TaxID=391736 RepID=A0ABT1H0C8_9NOCA|nr:MFS transporter [Williamsia serinedens]MCP2159978.1 putative arabinose efflux permease, MFS family [Williamsia serinedens]
MDSTSAWAPLRNAVYRNLFVAQLVSNIGLWMQTVGAQWFLVDRGASTTVIALVQTAGLAPSLVLSLPAGVLADLLDRRRLLIATSIYSLLGAAVLTAVSWVGALTPATLLAMTFLLACGAALTSPAWQAIQPELVPRAQIPAASSLGSVTVNAARAVGPALGGLVVAISGPTAVFALNAVSFVAIIAALVLWRRPRDHRATGRESPGAAIASGLRYVRSAPIVRRIMLRSALFAVPASALWALLPSASSDHLHLDASGYGAILGVLGVGGVAGVVVIPRARRQVGPNVILAASALIYAAGVIAIGHLPLVPTAVLLFFAGTAWIGTLTVLNASVQLSLAQWVRARAMSVYLLVFMGSQAVGSYVWGALAGAVGLGPTLAIAAAILVLVAASVVVLPLRAETGTLDRAVSTAWPTPTIVFDVDPTDGPVLVTVRWTVLPGRERAFVSAMRAVGRARRRTGAYRWGLFRQGDAPDVMLEHFMVRSWSEYESQTQTRWTASDHAAIEAARSHTVPGSVIQQPFVAIADDRMRAPSTSADTATSSP